MISISVPLFSQVAMQIGGGIVNNGSHFDQPFNGQFGLALEYTFVANQNIGVAFQHSNASHSLNMVHGAKPIPATLSNFQIVYKYTPPAVLPGFYIKPVISAGFINITRSAYIINLGAFGNSQVDVARQTYMVGGLGMEISQHLSDRIGIFVLPQFSVYSPEKGGRQLSITGGLNVTIL